MYEIFWDLEPKLDAANLIYLHDSLSSLPEK